MPSEQQIGTIGGKEPTLCAVSGRNVRGKHAVTHYKGDGTYVRVLNQFDHLWAKAAPEYGFPEPIVQDEQPIESDAFVLEGLQEEGRVTITDSNGKQTVKTFPAPSVSSGASRLKSAPRDESTSKGDD
jgi:hypothetical protein